MDNFVANLVEETRDVIASEIITLGISMKRRGLLHDGFDYLSGKDGTIYTQRYLNLTCPGITQTNKELANNLAISLLADISGGWNV